MSNKCRTSFFQRISVVLVLALAPMFAAAPAQAQHLVQWRHALLVAKANSGFFWMALHKGYFKKRGLDVQFVQFRGDKQVLRALLAGDVDSAELSPGSSLEAIERGATDLRFFGAGQPGFPYALFVRKGITRWSQLAGKTFGVSAPGSLPDVMARAMLKRKGINPNSIKIVNAGGSASRIRALVAGKIDAAASSSQFAAKAKQLGIRVMGYAADIVPEYPSTVFVTKESTLKAKPHAVVEFLAADMQGLRYAVHHRAATLALAAKMTHKKPNDPELTYTFSDTLKHRYLTLNSTVPRAKILWLEHELIKLGKLKHTIDLNKYIDQSYRDQALKLVGRGHYPK